MVHHLVIAVGHWHLLVRWITCVLLLEMYLLVKSTASVHVVDLWSQGRGIGMLVLHHTGCFWLFELLLLALNLGDNLL